MDLLVGNDMVSLRNNFFWDASCYEVRRDPLSLISLSPEVRPDPLSLFLISFFLLKNKELEPEFDKMLKEAGISGLKGHRSVGGYRASMYNALPLESVKVLTSVMREIANKFA